MFRTHAKLIQRASRAVCFGCVVACVGCIAPPAADKAPKVHRIEASPAPQASLLRAEEHLVKFCRGNDLPGATLGFVLADGSAGTVAAGVSCKADNRPMQPTDRMFSGSVGKMYVAALLLLLVEDDLVELDAPISRWFGAEEWFERLPNGPDLTVRMLLNHTSGIRRHIFVPELQARVEAEPHRTWQPEELIAYVLDTEPLFPAGEGWAYADTNYILIGMIIEMATGRTYYQELDRRILGPLGLVDTAPGDHPQLRGLISGYTREQSIFGLSGEVARNGRYVMNPQLEWTGGGLITTALDLAHWGSMLYGGKVLAAESLEELVRGVPAEEGSGDLYGMGTSIRTSPHGPAWGHSGWFPGYVSSVWYYPNHDVAVAVQINTDAGINRKLLRTLVDEVADRLIRH